jgi:hydrogenase nickel incorporation protein HypB
MEVTALEIHLKLNDVTARSLRERFRRDGVFVVSLVSSPGAGKTAFLEKTLTVLHRKHRVAALVGDLATDNDAARLARSQAPVQQITTGTLCHLEAAMVQNALDGWDIANWICCSSKTSATWFVPLLTIWAKTCAWS